MIIFLDEKIKLLPLSDDCYWREDNQTASNLSQYVIDSQQKRCYTRTIIIKEALDDNVY